MKLKMMKMTKKETQKKEAILQGWKTECDTIMLYCDNVKELIEQYKEGYCTLDDLLKEINYLEKGSKDFKIKFVKEALELRGLIKKREG